MPLPASWLQVGILLSVLAAGGAKGADPRPDALAAAVRGAPLLVATLHWAKAWNGPERESLRALSTAHPIVPTWWLKDATEQFGIAADAVERVSIVAHPVPSGLGVPGRNIAFVLTTVDAGADAWLEKLLGPSQEKQIDGRTLRESIATGGSALLIDERTVLFASDRGHNPAMILSGDKPDAAWQTFLAEADAATLATARGDVKLIFPPLAAIPAGHPLAPLAQAQAVQVTVDLQPQRLRIVVRGQFADADAATKASAALATMIPPIDGYVQAVGAGFPNFLTAQQAEYPRAGELAAPLTAAVDAARKALADAKPKVDGTAAELAFDLATDRPAVTLLMLTTLLPRAQKPPAK